MIHSDVCAAISDRVSFNFPVLLLNKVPGSIVKHMYIEQTRAVETRSYLQFFSRLAEQRGTERTSIEVRLENDII